MKKIIYFSTICLILNSCSQAESLSNINLSLNKASKNRTELEYVLQFYKESGDTLKLKAAHYLIKNMLYHFSLDSEKSQYFYNMIDSTLLNTKYNTHNHKHLIDSLHKSSIFNIKWDTQTLTAKNIIQNIECAFNLWDCSPWCQHLDFNEFCEYILPYRLCNKYTIESREKIQDILIDSNLKSQLNSLQYSSETKNSAFWACMIINQKLKELDPEHSANEFVPIYKISTRAKIPSGTCEEYAIITATIMRSLGIPVGIDFTPQWPFRSLGHTWNTLLTNSGRILTFGGADTNPDIIHKPDSKMSKVYRYTYEINPTMLAILEAEKNLPESLNKIHIKDVTKEYMKTSTITIPIRNKRDHQYSYLAVFDNQSWIPVCYSKQKTSNSFVFENIGRDIVYLPVYYENGIIVPYAPPFILDIQGNLHYLEADTSQIKMATLNRKYYLSERMLKYARRCIGAIIEASNKKDFSISDTLYEIQKMTFTTDSIIIKSNKKYRYWRYVSQPKTLCNIAELEFKYKNKSIKGNIIGTNGTYDSLSLEKSDKYAVFDKDPLTFFDAPQNIKHAWVGIDFKKPVSIDKILYTPRNDDNNIRIGDLYELFYWDNNQWNSLGKQKATLPSLHFKVPSNALLLLKNHSRGREERIFTYKNNMQHWW